MAQYVIWIVTTAIPERPPFDTYPIGWLAVSFEVTSTMPIPGTVPDEYNQVVMTNTDSFNGIIENYAEYGVASTFRENGIDIEVIGPVTDSWPIN